MMNRNPFEERRLPLEQAELADITARASRQVAALVPMIMRSIVIPRAASAEHITRILRGGDGGGAVLSPTPFGRQRL